MKTWGKFYFEGFNLFKNFIKENRFSILKVVEQNQIPKENEIRS